MTDQTQDPPEGQEQGDQGKTDLEARFAQLQRQLADKDKEARQHQRRADRLEQRNLRLATKRVQEPTEPAEKVGAVPARRPGRPTKEEAEERERQEAAEELARMAEEAQLELLKLRALTRHGLTEDDLGEDFEFGSPAELETKLTSIRQQREIDQLRQALEASKEDGSGSSDVTVDSGGLIERVQTVVDGGVQRANLLRQQATDLRDKENYQSATWLALRAAHRDPNKASPYVKPDSD